MVSHYQADVRALLVHLAAGNRPLDLDQVATDLLARSGPKPKPISGPTDTASMSITELFAHYKRTAITEDLAFFLRLDLSPALRARAENLIKPTAKDIRALNTSWRIERQTSDRERGIPSIGSPHWVEYAAILYAPEPVTEEIAS